jgi:DNA-directed RNA polymerase sigma subunit (sigma70/sigma32)
LYFPLSEDSEPESEEDIRFMSKLQEQKALWNYLRDDLTDRSREVRNQRISIDARCFGQMQGNANVSWSQKLRG